MQINVRCFSCHTAFSIKIEEVEAALTEVYKEGHKHYNALCPRCGRANKVSKKQLHRASPKWEMPAEKKVKKPAGEAKKPAVEAKKSAEETNKPTEEVKKPPKAAKNPAKDSKK